MRLDVAALVLAVAFGLFWTERSHRVVIEAPDAANPAALAAAAGCSDNDTMPYGERCLQFLDPPGHPAPSVPVAVSLTVPTPCPDSDGVPYSAGCLAFLRGATDTGMRWRMTAPSFATPGGVHQ